MIRFFQISKKYIITIFLQSEYSVVFCVALKSWTISQEMARIPTFNCLFLLNRFSENDEKFLGCVYIRRPHTIYVNSFVRSSISLFTCKMTDFSRTYQVVTIYIKLFDKTGLILLAFPVLLERGLCFHSQLDWLIDWLIDWLNSVFRRINKQPYDSDDNQ